MNEVAIIICTYNQEGFLRNCLNSLYKINYKNYKVFLVDDSGIGSIANSIKTSFSNIYTIINKSNLGFSKSNNVGIRKALKEYSPDYILLLNDDTEIVKKDWLKELVKTFEFDEKIGIVAPAIINANGTIQNLGGFIKGYKITTDKIIDKQIKEVGHVMGACMLIKREVIEKIGLLDEVFSPYLLEDTDYCLRTIRAGFKIMSNRNVKLIHYKGQSINKGEKENE